jgi:hypothetical protein
MVMWLPKWYGGGMRPDASVVGADEGAANGVAVTGATMAGAEPALCGSIMAEDEGDGRVAICSAVVAADERAVEAVDGR